MLQAKVELDQIEEVGERNETIEIIEPVTTIPNLVLESSQSMQIEKEWTEEPYEPYSDLI